MRRILGIAQVQLRLDPLIVRQLQLPRGVQRHMLQVVDERLGNFGKQRRLATVTGVEITYSGMPALLAQRLAHHREAASQQAFDGAIEQLTVNLQAPGLDAGRRGMALWVAQVTGQGILLRTQGLIHLLALRQRIAQHAYAPSRPTVRPRAGS
ncbi:hypothetical protein D3C72_1563090 [compost metagenome]